MKTKTLILSMCLLITVSGISFAQQTQLSWSSFSNGFGATAGSNTKIQSQFGEPLVGSNQQGATTVGSGFLPNPIVFQAPCNYSCIRVFVEGPMNIGTGLMSNTLKTGGILASRFPGIPIPAAAVDSIAIELRNAVANPTTRKIRPAWLLTDGSIRAFNDTLDHYVEFDTLPGNYYLAIYHRNHLAIITSSSQVLMGIAPPAYDFSTAQSQAYGTNPMKLMGTKYCMYAGDANQSDIVSASDANVVFGLLNVTGYQIADVNLSGIITASDANMVFGNLNAARQFNRPSESEIVPQLDAGITVPAPNKKNNRK